MPSVRLTSDNLTDAARSLRLTFRVVEESNITFHWGHGDAAAVQSAWESCGRMAWEVTSESGVWRSAELAPAMWAISSNHPASVAADDGAHALGPSGPPSTHLRMRYQTKIDGVPEGAIITLELSSNRGDPLAPFILASSQGLGFVLIESEPSAFHCGASLDGFKGRYVRAGDFFGAPTWVDSASKEVTLSPASSYAFSVLPYPHPLARDARCSISVSAEGGELGRSSSNATSAHCHLAGNATGAVTFRLDEVVAFSPTVAHFLWERKDPDT